jgi:hypothetical protein
LQAPYDHPFEDDAVLSGLTVYSSDFVPLGRIAGVVDDGTSDPDSLAGRLIAIQPNKQVQSMLADDDLVVSESMIYDTSPDQDRVILNVTANRVVALADQLDEHR